jgi:hypothetical protein
MRKFTFWILFVIGVAGSGYAQNMPKKVKRFLDNYTNDSMGYMGPLHARERGRLGDSVKIKDLKVEKVVEIYQFKHIFLNAYPDTVPFFEIIEPTGYWFVLITAHGKPLYELVLDNTQEEPVFIVMSSLPPGGGFMWKPLLDSYTESMGKPVYFSRFGFLFGHREHFLYFKQKGPRKIFYIGNGVGGDPLRPLFSESINDLDDSKLLIEYWKKQGINEVGIGGDGLGRRRNKK